jgi:oligopeptidase A
LPPSGPNTSRPRWTCCWPRPKPALERAVSVDVPADYDTLSMLLDVPVERLQCAWGHVGHLQAVADTPALRAAHAHNLPRVIDFSTRLGADARLYAKVKAVAQGQPLPAEPGTAQGAGRFAA